MKYEIVSLEKKEIAGYSIRTTNHGNQAVVAIGRMWQEFFEKNLIESIENRISQTVIGLYTEYEGDYTKPYTFVCGCEVSSKKETKTIYEGEYAKFTVYGDSKTAVGPIWQYVWQSDLDRNYRSDFEEYHFDFNEEGHQTIDVYIGLKKQID